MHKLTAFQKTIIEYLANKGIANYILSRQKCSKKQIYFFSATFFLITSLLTFLYLSRITIYEPICITINTIDKEKKNNFFVIGIEPLCKEVLIPFDSNSNAWKINSGYYKEIIVKSNVNIIENHPLQINVKNLNSTENYSLKSNLSDTSIIIVGNNIGQNNLVNKIFSVLKTNIEHFKIFFLIALVLSLAYLIIRLHILAIFNKYALVVILVFGLFCIILPTFFSFPNVEDLSLVVVAMKTTIINGTVQTLATFDGRYFTNFLHGLSPIVYWGLESYKFVLIFSIILTYLSHIFFVFSFSFFTKKSWSIIIFPSLFITIHFAITPSIVHDIYWMASSFVYLWAWNFLLIWTSFLKLMINEKKYGYKFLYFISAFAFLIFSYGINEMMIIINSIALFYFIIYTWRYHKSSIIDIIPFVFISLCCIYIFISSPGIQYRINSGVSRNLNYYIDVINSGSIYTLKTTYDWLFSNIFTIPLFIIFTSIFHKDINPFLRFSNRSIISLFLCCFLLIFLLPFSFFIPMGVEYYPERIYNFMNWIFQVAIFILLPIFIIKKVKNIRIITKNHRAIAITLSSLLVLCHLAFYKNNFKTIITEWSSGEFDGYKTEMNNRYSAILKAKQNTIWSSVELESIKHKPTTIYTKPDIEPNRFEEFWNIAYENYFNVDEIKIKNDTICKINSILKYVKK
ncbi:MAG: DUF6056 family protein [Bacteroidota bacterium]